jgi:hypothetical protein
LFLIDRCTSYVVAPKNTILPETVPNSISQYRTPSWLLLSQEANAGADGEDGGTGAGTYPAAKSAICLGATCLPSRAIPICRAGRCGPRAAHPCAGVGRPISANLVAPFFYARFIFIFFQFYFFLFPV